MKKIAVSVGLDYSDSVVQVCVIDEHGELLRNKACQNDWRAIQARVKPEERVKVAVIEACTGAADLADELIGKAGWPVVLALPGVVKRMKCNPDKSDWADGRLLGDLGRVNYVPRVWLPPHAVRELQLVVRHRQQLVDARRATKLRIGAVLRQQRVRLTGSRWSKAWMADLLSTEELSAQGRWLIQRFVSEVRRLNQQIAEVDQHLMELAGDDWMVRWLLGLRGIGTVTACVIRAEIGSFTRFPSAKALARYCGVTPRNASSGTRQADAGQVRAGNALLRRTLIEMAHRLVRLEPRWREMAATMRARGKPGNVVVAAVANRWVRSIHAPAVRLEQAA